MIETSGFESFLFVVVGITEKETGSPSPPFSLRHPI
jgi:hypothetical protein